MGMAESAIGFPNFSLCNRGHDKRQPLLAGSEPISKDSVLNNLLPVGEVGRQNLVVPAALLCLVERRTFSYRSSSAFCG